PFVVSTTREGQHTRPIEIIGGDRRARGARRGQCRAPGRTRAHGAHGPSHGNRRGAPHTIIGTRSAPASTAGTTLCGSRSSARTAPGDGCTAHGSSSLVTSVRSFCEAPRQ